MYNFHHFFSFCLLGLHSQHKEVLRLGSNQRDSCRPMPQRQQHGIRAATATYTTAHGRAGSLTHCAGPGIELATTWFLAGFVSAAPLFSATITFINVPSDFVNEVNISGSNFII